MTNCWKFSAARGTDLLVLLALADVADDRGECWPSVRHLATKCRLDERTAQRRMRSLERLGEVEVVPGGGRSSGRGGLRSNRYRIVVRPPDAPDGGDSPPRQIATGGTDATQTPAPVPPMTPAQTPPDPSVDPLIDPSLSLSSEPEGVERGEVVRQALQLLAERRVAARIASGLRVHSRRAYLRTVLDDVSAEYGAEVAKRYANNPAWSAEELASQFDQEPLERGTPLEI